MNASTFFHAVYSTLFRIHNRHSAIKRGEAANDMSCSGCGAHSCHCPDPVWSGLTPPGAA